MGVAGDDDDTPWVQTPRSGRVRKPGRTPTGELLVDLAIRQDADIYQPLHPRSVEVAENAAAAIVDATVLSQPDWPAPAIRNLIRLAPAESTLFGFPANTKSTVWPTGVPKCTPP